MAADSNDNDEIGRFETQYRENPTSLVFARLADAYRKAGNPERGLSILADGIARHPDYPSAHIVRARCLVDLDRLAAAEASLRRVMELDGQNLVAIQGLANLAERRDDPAEAVHWFERIAALDPLNVEAAAALARLRPISPPPPTGLEPLPAPSEEWWSSPAFQIESVDANVDREDGEEDVPSVDAEEPDSAVDSESAADDGSGEAWWFEDPGDDEPVDDGDLLTRTMAELYTRQGLLDEAAAIYRELLSDRPDDAGLRRALDELERRLAGGDDAEETKQAEGEQSEAEAVDAEAVEAEAVEAEAVEAEAVEAEAEPAVVDAQAAPAGPERVDVEAARQPDAAPRETDPFTMHPVPASSGTGKLLDDWLRRLAE
jgi:tetratricopeptide (TPR) repeat protein